MKLKIYFILFLSSITIGLFGQSADKTEGCAPLTVNFTGPVLATYYWEFGDNKQSTEVTPTNIYSQPGNYTATLRESVNGEIVGTVDITIYEKPNVMISADVLSGCAPLNVQFSNESEVDENINITGYIWNFGGQSSNEENPMATFSNEGTYQAILRIEASNGCSVTGTDESLMINVSGKVDGDISLDQNFSCTTPAEFTIENTIDDNAGYSFNWDFGNGTSSDLHNPGTITYENEGTYTITLTVNDNQGCIVEFIETVDVGRPDLNISTPDSICIDQFFTLGNTSSYDNYEWDFGDDGFPSQSEIVAPAVKFSSGGIKEIKLSAYDDPSCKKDTTIIIFVEDPNPSFTSDPMRSCEIPTQYNFIADNNSYASYRWTIYEKNSPIVKTTIITEEPTLTYDYTDIPTDTFYINRPDSFIVKLTVVSDLGCSSEQEIIVHHRAPEAYFIPNKVNGCAPLNINFTDYSRSFEDIVSWTYLLDENEISTSSSSGDYNHEFTQPGEYKMRVIIENDAGCIDTSSGIMIYVGELLESNFTLSQSEICLGDTIDFIAENLDPRIDGYHFVTDGDRVEQCYLSPEVSHDFIHLPGVYPVHLLVDYNGCVNEVSQEESITVNGAKSRIRYMINCEDPYTVMLQDSSVNATNTIWIFENDTIDMSTVTEDFINYTFDTTGDFQVKLVAFANDDTCPPDTSNVLLHIRDIQADFILPDAVCADVGYYLDASSSVDVDNSCFKGYRWDGVDFRPRVTPADSVLGGWPAGPFEVRLITEDVNGCKDTITKSSISYDQSSSFTIDREPICLPGDVEFTDLSSADTTIINWSWNFNQSGASEDQNPTFTFPDLGGPPSALSVQLIIEDAIGCMDTSLQMIQVYEPISDIAIDPGQIVCVGETIDFSATDFTQQGSSLDFDWDFGPFGNSNEQSPSILVDRNGTNNYELVITEKATGCQTTIPGQIISYNKPIASFVDIGDQICVGENKLLINNSVIDGDVTYIWQFSDNNAISSDMNPEYIFNNKGTVDVTLTVNARVDNCFDSVTQSITVVGPEGTIGVDKDEICIGEEVTLTLEDPVDVENFNWNFSGNTYSNQNPLIVEFDPVDPDDDVEVVTLELISSDGCKYAIEESIDVFRVGADFSFMRDTLLPCIDSIFFINESLASDSYSWDFGGLGNANESDPVFSFPDGIGDYPVTLIAYNGVCADSTTKIVNIDFDFDFDIPNVFSPNGDGVNDYFDIVVKLPIEDTELDIRTCYTVVKAMIFDRWGTLVYNNELPEEGWDGRYDNGDYAPADVYTYKFVIEKEDGTAAKALPPGTVTIIR